MSTYIPSWSIARSRCQSMVDLQPGKFLSNKSRKSEITEGCVPGSSKHCPYLIKFKPLDSDDELTSFLRELYFAQYVNAQLPNLKSKVGGELDDVSFVTPQIHDAWICPQLDDSLDGYLVMDRMGMNLLEYVQSKYLTDDKITNILQHLEKLFQCLVKMNIWHRNITLTNIVMDEREHLYIIDWDNVLWNPDQNEEALVKRYVRIMKELKWKMKRENARAMKHPIPNQLRLEKQPLPHPSYAFAPVVSVPAIERTSTIEQYDDTKSPSPITQYSLYEPIRQDVIQLETPPQSFSNFSFSSAAPVRSGDLML